MNLGGRRIEFVVKSTIDPDVIRAQVKACFARDLPRFHDLPDIGKATGPVALIAGGPSLNGEFENLRNFPGPLVACGSVHDHLIENGIIPKYAVMLDPDKAMADFVKLAHPDVCYLVASHSHPAMFDALEGMNVRVWHVLYSNIIPDITAQLRGEPEIGGGDGAILRAWPLMAVMGHRDLHFYGFDLSFPEGCDSQHAYDYGLLKEEPMGIALQTGERFVTSAGWVNQLNEFNRMLSMTSGQFEITFHGDGLVAATYCRGKEPGAAEKFARGNEALLRGDFIAGFAGCEYRQGLRGARGLPLPATKEWQGEPLIGKTLLLHGEQGYGDMIMVLRYVKILIECGAKILMAIQPGLRSIAERIPNITVIDASPATWPPYDVWLGMMSLPHRFGTTLDNILWPFQVELDPVGMEKFRQPPGFNVGLCWQANPEGELAEYKSIPFDVLRSLFNVDGVNFVSLQVPSPYPNKVELIAPKLDTFLDTAHLIANLDLVITVDTAVAHLAGTLGIPTWVVLSKDPVHVPWMLDREDSPWYLSVRLFRQRAGERGWMGVIGRVRDKLAEAASNGIITVNSVRKRCLDFEMEMDLADLHSSIEAVTFEAGDIYEPEIVHFLQRVLRPGDLFVDVGSNIGFFTLLAASRGADVIAVEPHPGNAARVRCNAKINGFDDRIVVCNVAAWHEPATLDFFTRAADTGGSALWNDGGQRKTTVHASRLDSLLAGRQRPRMMKIDVEGSEEHVVDGLGDCRPDYVTCELYPYALDKMGSSQGNLRKKMREHGYDMFTLSDTGEKPKFVPENEYLRPHIICNVLFSTQAAVDEAWGEQLAAEAAE